MKRRGFFKSLAALAGAVSMSPTIFIPKFEPVRWKLTEFLEEKTVINPAYLNAAYEWIGGNFSGYWSIDLRENPRGPTDTSIPYPIRYSLIDPVTFLPVSIPPFIKG